MWSADADTGLQTVKRSPANSRAADARRRTPMVRPQCARRQVGNCLWISWVSRWASSPGGGRNKLRGSRMGEYDEASYCRPTSPTAFAIGEAYGLKVMKPMAQKISLRRPGRCGRRWSPMILTKGRRGQWRGRVAEIRVVQHVERFQTEIEIKFSWIGNNREIWVSKLNALGPRIEFLPTFP